MARKTKALTRKITRKRALSYDRMAPNRRGVTAMSEVNGEGAYERRGRKRRSRRAEDRPVRKSGSRKAKRRSTKRTSSKRGMTPNKRKTPLKRDFLAEQMAKGRTEAQAKATWDMLTRRKQKSAARKKKGRTYGGKKKQYKALKAKAGRGRSAKTKWTYLYRTKRGNTRKIPDHALMGYSSAAEVSRIQRTGTERERERLARKMNALFERRARAAERAEQAALQGKAWFSPNAGDDVLDYEEWSKTMKKNARKKKSSSRKPKYGTKAYYKWLGKKGAAARKRKSGGTKKRSTKRSSSKRTSSRKPKYGTKAYYKWLGKKGAAARKRKSGGTKKRSTSRKSSTRRKSSSKRSSSVRRDAAGRRITPKRRAAARRNLKKACSTVRKMKANKKGAYSSRKRSGTKSIAKRKSSSTKSYKRNAKGAAFKQELMNSMKFGAIVLGGFVTHRLVTNMLDKHVLGKIDAFNSGTIGEYRKTIGGVLAALVGIPLTVRVLPKHAGVAAAGMAASLLYDLVLTGLQKAKQPALLDAISAYPDAPGYAQYSGMGSYYTYGTHEVYGGANGLGSYYETSYVPGLEQAAAGMGGGEMLTQAAAGVPQLQQMWANPMGEYFATGAEGIGEYESMAGGGAGGGYIDDGIHPNMHHAEQSLDVAEAAAGIGSYDGAMLTQAAAGFGDLPLEQTVTPQIRAMDIPDGPGGSRAGILAGGDGIFG
jgi:hypothetical protein